MGAKRILKRIVPQPIRSRLRRLVPKAKQIEPNNDDRPYSARYPARRDLSFLDLGNGLTLAVFWKDLPIGSGPAFSVHFGSFELLKFDCFGETGHFHTDMKIFGLNRETRLKLPEPTRRAQVERALFEIQQNAAYYLCRSPNMAGKGVQPDPEKTAAACKKARLLAYHFIETVPELQDGPTTRNEVA